MSNIPNAINIWYSTLASHVSPAALSFIQSDLLARAGVKDAHVTVKNKPFKGTRDSNAFPMDIIFRSNASLFLPVCFLCIIWI